MLAADIDPWSPTRARGIVLRALAEAARIEPELGVAAYAEAHRHVAPESGSAKPGKWSNATVPLAVEIMDCLDADHPAHTVTACMAAQLVKSEIGMNWLFQTIDCDPAPFLFVTPSIEELRQWNATKWGPNVEANPRIARKVIELVERSGESSTTTMKKFRGGFASCTTASSSKGLQAKSVKRIWMDEVSEYALEVGGRGDPIQQALTRTDAHPDFKVYFSSTPKELPACRITRLFEAGDQRRPYLPCPHCGVFQQLILDRLVEDGARAAYACAACGAVIEETRKADMLARGVWLKTYAATDATGAPDPADPSPPDLIAPEDIERWRARSSGGRDPSFTMSQMYSSFKSWTRLRAEWVEAQKDPDKLKVFWQQKLGLAWNPALDAGDPERLFAARGRHVQRGVVPLWAPFLTLVADVQGDRIEWALYAWGPDLTGARIDWGVIQADPLFGEAWAELGRIAQRRWPGDGLIDLGADIAGVDSGGQKGVTARAYAFVAGRPGWLALKGSSDAEAIPLERGKKKSKVLPDGRRVFAHVHLVGGSSIKKTVAALLKAGADAADEGVRARSALYFTADSTEEDFAQLTAEVWREPETRRVGVAGWWERLPGRANEQLDLAVYAYALMWAKTRTWTASDWARLTAERASAAAPAALPLFERTPEPAAPLPANPGLRRDHPLLAAARRAREANP